jgi:PAS domain S-box-containing protein
MFIIDKDLNILQHNRAFAELLGRKPEDITGKKCHELVHGLKEPPDFCATCAAMKEQRSIKAELYEPYLGRHLAVSADPTFDSNGNFEFAIHIIRDITERNAFEEERNGLIHKLGERVKELRALHELSRLIEKTGTTLPEILEGTAQIIPPAWRYPEVTCARVTLGGEEFKTENFTKTEWSQSSDITVHGTREGTIEVYYLEERPEAEEGPFLSEERILLEVLAERLGRVIERVRVEEALRDERDFIDVAINALSDGFYVLSVAEQGKFIRWNKVLVDITGYSDDELSNMTIFDLFDEEGKKRQQAFLLELLEKGQASIEIDVVTKDGRRIPYHARSTLVRDAQGNPLYVCGVARDVTERKLAEEQLQGALNELARSNAELEQFAYSASHDLQEPLRMVSSYVQLLERRYKDKLDPDAADFIGFAVDGVHRMQNLISDLLEYSRVGMRGKPLRPTEAGAALDHALSNLEVAIKESGAVITRDDLPTVMADETQLIQLFQNLIGNAITFRGDDKPSIHISAERKPGEYLFSVRDNGIGVDPGQSEHIFQIFQRLHTRSERSGTGIGLAVCKRIVERHDGLIWVESEPGSGSTFFFTLPITVREEQ